MERTCSKCRVKKELNADNFGKKRTGKHGYESVCKVCKKERDRKRYLKNKDKISKQKKEYYERNKEKIKQNTLNYYYKNKANK